MKKSISQVSVFSAICFLIIFSCGRSNKMITAPISENANYSYEIDSIERLSITVPEGKFSKFHSTTIFDDRFVYGVNLNAPNVIDVYDIVEKRMVNNAN
jgi:hypothetical protein